MRVARLMIAAVAGAVAACSTHAQPSPHQELRDTAAHVVEVHVHSLRWRVIADASVTLGVQTTRTDETGMARFHAPNVGLMLRVRADGFEPQWRVIPGPGVYRFELVPRERAE